MAKATPASSAKAHGAPPPDPPTPPSAVEITAELPAEPAAPSGVLSRDDLVAFRAAGSSPSDRLNVLTAALRVTRYALNSRVLVYVDFLLGLLCFALDDAQLSDEQALRLAQIAHDVFTFATSTHRESSSLPTLQATYDVFRERIRDAATAADDTAPCFSPADVSSIVRFLSATFFRHLAAIQRVFRAPRESRLLVKSLTVERPLPAPPLALAALSESANQN
ncbi:hypothetical protein P43SY_002476 [Pythium insidiosum]|uniref:Uncharacterized protein n=1 Tax=Pythium insidiosum TaxID=114742 RepID=A0AAD5LXH8_PYTIN|nr:hypothetical protein P43SY_002476 [Pythium insidiosum]